MSLERFFRWTCEGCAVTAERADYGLPRGRIFVKGIKTTHRCPSCAESVPKDKRGDATDDRLETICSPAITGARWRTRQ